MATTETLLIAAAGVLALVFAWDLFIGGSLEDAIERTVSRWVGMWVGILTAMGLVILQLIELVAWVPEAAITLLGIGAIVGGFDWEMFLAAAVLTYIVVEVILLELKGRPT